MSNWPPKDVPPVGGDFKDVSKTPDPPKPEEKPRPVSKEELVTRTQAQTLINEKIVAADTSVEKKFWEDKRTENSEEKAYVKERLQEAEKIEPRKKFKKNTLHH